MNIDEVRKKLAILFRDGKMADTELHVYCAIFENLPFEMEFSVADSRGFINTIIQNNPQFELLTQKTDRESRTRFKSTYIYLDFKNKIMLGQGSFYGTPFMLYPADTDKSIIDNMIYSATPFFKKERAKVNRGNIYILAIKGKAMKASMQFIPFKIPNFDIKIERNYNDDFLPIHNEVIKSLSEKDNNGIVILRGLPGTGKTYYIRHLCKTISKKILYIPPALVNYITEPSFIQLLGKNKNSILLIEDADNVIRKRDTFSNIQDVSSLLNIADGLLKDVLNLQIVVTFNTDITNVDEAFLRKGRLIAEYEFKELEKKKAQILSDHLGYKSKIEKDSTLAEIYNQNKSEIKTSKKKIGFSK
jgi:hypothetical protein